MPARHPDITCVPDAPTLLTDGAVTAVRVQSVGADTITLQATATATPPIGPGGGVRLQPFTPLDTDMTLAKLFPGIGAGAMFLWAYVGTRTLVSVSHA